MRILDKLLIKLYIKVHNFLYHKISITSMKINNNIHPKHEIMKYYQFFIDNIDESSEILDFGCGIGYLSYKLADKAKRIVGIDINKNSIKFAKKNYNKNNIEYIVGDVLDYNFEKKFDVIILSNILEHINARIEFLKKIKKIANYFLIRVPMLNRSWLPLYEKSLGLDYRLDSSHYIEYTLKTFKDEIEAAGLKVVFYEIQFGEIWAKCATS